MSRPALHSAPAANASHWGLALTQIRLALGSSSDANPPRDFTSVPDPSARPRRNAPPQVNAKSAKTSNDGLMDDGLMDN